VAERRTAWPRHRHKPPRNKRRNPRHTRPQLRKLTQTRTGRTTQENPSNKRPPRTGDHSTAGRGGDRAADLPPRSTAPPRGSISASHTREAGSDSSHHPHPYTTERSPQLLRPECAGQSCSHPDSWRRSASCAPDVRGRVEERKGACDSDETLPRTSGAQHLGATPRARSEVGNIPAMHTKPPHRRSSQ